MSGQMPISEEFLPLLDAACDGTLVETQCQELTALLNSDPVVRKVFIDHVRLRTNIRFLHRAERARDLAFARIQATPQALPPGSASPTFPFLSTTLHGTVGYFSSGWPVAYLVATVIFGIGLLLSSLHLRVPAGAGCQAICTSSLSSLPAPVNGRPDYGDGRLPVEE